MQDKCASCGQAAEERECSRCGRTATVIDCGHHSQPAEIAACDMDNRWCCTDCHADGSCAAAQG